MEKKNSYTALTQFTMRSLCKRFLEMVSDAFAHYVMFRNNCLLHFALNDENVGELLVESEKEFHAIIEE